MLKIYKILIINIYITTEKFKFGKTFKFNNNIEFNINVQKMSPSLSVGRSINFEIFF